MIDYTVLIPQRDHADAIGRVVSALERTFDDLLLPYEIICVDDGSSAPAIDALEALLYQHASLRILRFDQARGTSAALCAGLAAARGRLIMAVHPLAASAAGHLPNLISRLSRYDFVFAEGERLGPSRLGRRAQDAFRAAAGDVRLRDDDELLWAARREAVVALAVSSGAFRMLPALVAERGYRTCRVVLAEGLPPRASAFRLGSIGRRLVRWLGRRYEPHLALEMVREELTPARAHVAPFELPRARFVPQGVYMPAEHEHQDSA